MSQGDNIDSHCQSHRGFLKLHFPGPTPQQLNEGLWCGAGESAAATHRHPPLPLGTPKFENRRPGRPQSGAKTKDSRKQGQQLGQLQPQRSLAEPQNTCLTLHTGATPRPGFLKRGGGGAFHVSRRAEGLRLFA